jgi:hypothetical protein
VGLFILWGLLMPAEPPFKRSFLFLDGQNLFYAVKHASDAATRITILWRSLNGCASNAAGS